MTDEKKDVIHVDSGEVRDGIVPIGTYECCPHCGGEFTYSFGLAGGGFGPYNYCSTCERVIEKDQEIEE